MGEELINVAVVLAVVCVPVAYWLRYRRTLTASRQKLHSAAEKGMTEPASLHPMIDANRCISTGACLDACPEGGILGIVNGRAELVSPTKCIGHGACLMACPVDAISLVFGTERRGVDIPHIRETFETNVDGIYIAGELGGMGLIRNAITQGREAVDFISKSLKDRDPQILDLIVVGAGPGGLSAALQARKRGLRSLTVEQEEEIGGTILSYPRQKIVMTEPMDIPMYGKFRKKEVLKEELVDLFREITAKYPIPVNAGERVESIERHNGHFRVTTNLTEHLAKRVLLAIGRRGTPRKLGVQGEASSKVTYKLLDPEQYKHKHILVVGGGDSAVEAAISLSEQEGTMVSLSYRRNAFSRLKEANETRIRQVSEAGMVKVYFESTVKEIQPDNVVLTQHDRELVVRNDFVFVMVGGELPTAFLQKVGVHTITKFGER